MRLRDAINFATGRDSNRGVRGGWGSGQTHVTHRGANAPRSGVWNRVSGSGRNTVWKKTSK